VDKDSARVWLHCHWAKLNWTNKQVMGSRFMKSIHEVLAEFRASSIDERDKGDLFESLVLSYLQVDPAYSDYFDKVWLYPAWARENGLPGNDVGIDLVARNRETGDITAIQCKFYAENAYLDKKEIDSFFTASGKDPFRERIIFSTTDNWSKNAEDAIHNQQIPVVRVRVQDLDESGIDWSSFSLKTPDALSLKPKKTPFAHQEEAIQAAKNHFAEHERGKLIMACGTGKTFTSLRIVEELVPSGGTVLFLVPSIALLSQTLKEWKNESQRNFRAYAVCSDSKVGRRVNDEDIQTPDLAYPATTNTQKLAAHFKGSSKSELTVIFSTYQSIDVVAQAQKSGVPEFDLIVCDEAHRTTGVTLSGDDESSFVRVHSNAFIRGKKRMYMTATPRIYADASKQKAQEADAVLASMDDEALYGPEFHRLNFGQAVSRGLLSDYKVLVLAVSENHVSKALQRLLAKHGELEMSDAIKIVGCYNGLRKRGDNPDDFLVDTQPMKTAVAFARSIKESKHIASMFAEVASALNEDAKEKDPLKAEAEHVDGTFNVLARNQKLDWLKDKSTSNTVRILSNARCLSEGVDVPALDAVLFLNPRDSQVDVVQSVGRVMRKSPGKDYGYVILPIPVPAGQSPEEALSDNRTYKVVWQVLQALRSHDERFDAMVNKLELTGNTSEVISIIGVGTKDDSEPTDGKQENSAQPVLFDWAFDEWKDAIYAKIVQKVGQRTYWENWAKDVTDIAKNHISRVTDLVSGNNDELRKEFDQFLKGLRDNLNPSISQAEAIEMLAQHLITKPVFDALFEGYAFTELNPVSVSMERMVAALDAASVNREADSLESFYESVRLRASGITDGGAKQKIVKELYEKFFRLAFAGTSEKLGIVYTPNEIVDFLLHSVDDLLKSEFGSGIGAPGVHILDPFTGTGTFIVRLIQSGLISREELDHKFRYELHANEIVLLAYYVAAINIEEAFHSITDSYQPFQGVVLTDSFQMTEGRDSLDSLGVFPDNNERVKKQNALDIRVVIGNPPYSVGQKSGNDDNKNMKYEDLDGRILETYARMSSAGNKRNLYDSYVRAYRWASDRIKERGVVAFVSNGGWLDSKSADGLRKSLIEEYTNVYIINLRGNANTQGERRRKEGGGVFGEGSRTPVAVTILVKNPEGKSNGKVQYFEVDDGLSGTEKLALVEGFKSITNVPLQLISPNEAGDWINQRSSEYEDFVPLTVDGESKHPHIFRSHAVGISTNRDSWAYNFDKAELNKNIRNLITNFNENVSSGKPQNLNPKEIKWSRSLKKLFDKREKISFNESSIKLIQYRPMQKQWGYQDRALNDSPGTQSKFFIPNFKNIALVTGPDGAWLSDLPIDLHLNGPGALALPLYLPEGGDTDGGPSLFDVESTSYAITKEALGLFEEKLGKPVNEEEVFYYCYGVFSLPEFQLRFGEDLRKLKARVPISKNFFDISRLGRELADIQLNYETLNKHELQIVGAVPTKPIQKLRLQKNGEDWVLDIDGGCKLTGFPDAAKKFMIFGRTPVEWVVDRYQITIDKDSGIRNDPNAYTGSSDYIVSLVEKAVAMSVLMAEKLSKAPKL
jgi:predicted helicase